MTLLICTFLERSRQSQEKCELFVSHQLDEGTPPEPEGSFVDYQTSMVKHSKAIAVTAQEMVRPENISVHCQTGYHQGKGFNVKC